MERPNENRVALVTGGSTGFGRAVARRLAEAGARVLITGRHEETLRESASQHPNSGFLVADAAKPTNAARAIEEVIHLHGRLDTLVNDAAIATVPPRRFSDWVRDYAPLLKAQPTSAAQ